MRDLLIAIPGDWAEGLELGGPKDEPVWSLYEVISADEIGEDEPAHNRLEHDLMFRDAWGRAARLSVWEDQTYSWPPLGH